MSLLIAVLVAFGLAGGAVGWFWSSRTLYQRSFDPLDAAVLGRDDFLAQIHRRKGKRVLFSLMTAVLGVVVGFCVLFYLANRG